MKAGEHKLRKNSSLIKDKKYQRSKIYEVSIQLPKQDLIRDNIDKHTNIERGKPWGLDPKENYRHLRTVASRRNRLPEGRAHQLINQYQVGSPKNHIHITNIIQTQQVTFIYIWMCLHTHTTTTTNTETEVMNWKEQCCMWCTGKVRGRKRVRKQCK